MIVMRLSKIAKELNIGISTIRDFLKENGCEIDDNPNSKIQEEQYKMLLEEFQKEKTVKEESQMLGVDPQKKEIIFLDEDPNAPKTEDPISDVKSPFSFNETIKAKPDKDIEVKIVGKVDIEVPKKKKAVSSEEKPDLSLIHI